MAASRQCARRHRHAALARHLGARRQGPVQRRRPLRRGLTEHGDPARSTFAPWATVPQVDFSSLGNLFTRTTSRARRTSSRSARPSAGRRALAELGKLNPNDPNFAQQAAALAFRLGDLSAGVVADQQRGGTEAQAGGSGARSRSGSDFRRRDAPAATPPPRLPAPTPLRRSRRAAASPEPGTLPGNAPIVDPHAEPSPASVLPAPTSHRRAADAADPGADGRSRLELHRLHHRIGTAEGQLSPGSTRICCRSPTRSAIRFTGR